MGDRCGACLLLLALFLFIKDSRKRIHVGDVLHRVGAVPRRMMSQMFLAA